MASAPFCYDSKNEAPPSTQPQPKNQRSIPVADKHNAVQVVNQLRTVVNNWFLNPIGRYKEDTSLRIVEDITFDF